LDKTVKLWNPQDGSLLTTLKGHSHGVNAIAYSPDGAILASASHDNTVKLWNAQDGSLLTTLQGHANWVNAIAYSPDGTTLASASHDNTVKLWNVKFDLNLDSAIAYAREWLRNYLTHNPNVSASDKRLLEI
ncbi:MAG: hypothetical protein F6K21_15560, partial [Symploca sp. SIO2D2]|nr:hypothetical protein [Symploca sp. SIO2D2]